MLTDSHHGTFQGVSKLFSSLSLSLYWCVKSKRCVHVLKLGCLPLPPDSPSKEEYFNVCEANWERLLPAPNNRTDSRRARLSRCRQHGKTGLGVAGLFRHNSQPQPCKAVCHSCHVILLLWCPPGLFPATSLLFNWLLWSAYLHGIVITLTWCGMAVDFSKGCSTCRKIFNH